MGLALPGPGPRFTNALTTALSYDSVCMIAFLVSLAITSSLKFYFLAAYCSARFFLGRTVDETDKLQSIQCFNGEYQIEMMRINARNERTRTKHKLLTPFNFCESEPRIWYTSCKVRKLGTILNILTTAIMSSVICSLSFVLLKL